MPEDETTDGYGEAGERMETVEGHVKGLIHRRNAYLILMKLDMRTLTKPYIKAVEEVGNVVEKEIGAEVKP